MPVAGVQVSQPASSSAVFRCGSACAAPAGDRRFSCLLKSVSSWARCHIHHLYLHSCIVSMSIAISSTRPFAGVLTPARRPLTRRAVKVAFKITFKTPEGECGLRVSDSQRRWGESPVGSRRCEVHGYSCPTARGAQLASSKHHWPPSAAHLTIEQLEFSPACSSPP